MLTTQHSIDRDTIQKVQRTIREARIAVFLDIDDTLLNPSTKWLEIIEKHLNARFDLAEIYHKGGFYNYFTESDEYREGYLELTDYLINNDTFNTYFPILDGSLEGLQELQKIPGVTLAAYLTARPDTMMEITLENLAKLGFPQLPLIARPADTYDTTAEEWKLKILLDIAGGFDGKLLMVDDNINLTLKILQYNRRTPKSRLASLLLKSGINQNTIARDGLATQPEYGIFVAGWDELPDTEIGSV